MQDHRYRDLSETIARAAWVRRLAASLTRDAADADDLVQEVSAALLLKAVPEVRSLGGWMRSVLARNARHARRRDELRRTREHAAARPERVSSTEELVDRIAVLRELIEAVESLEEPYRTTLLLHYLEERSLAEIARLQDLPAATVRARLARGLARLRTRLRSRHGERWPERLAPLLVGWPLKESVAAGTLAAGGWILAVKKPTVAVVALALAVAAGLLLAFRERPATRGADASSSRPAIAATGGPEDIRAPIDARPLGGIVPAEPDSVVPAPQPKPRLWGRFVLDAPEPLRAARAAAIRARVWSDSPAREWRARPLQPIGRFAADVAAEIGTHGPFEIEVPRAADWIVRLTVPPALNWLELTAHTEYAESWTASMVAAIEVPVDGAPQGADFDVAARITTAEGHEVLPARRIEDGPWRLNGPFLLPIEVGIRRAGITIVEWQRYPLRSGSLPFPADRELRRFACVDAASGRAVRDVDASIWRTGGGAREEGFHPDGVVPHLFDRSHLDVRATFRAPGWTPRMLALSHAADYEALKTDDAGSWLIEMLPEGRPGGTLVDCEGRPVAGASLVAMAGADPPRLPNGTTRDDGRFTLGSADPVAGIHGITSPPVSKQMLPVSRLAMLVTESDGTRSLLEDVSWSFLYEGNWTGVLGAQASARSLVVTSRATGLPLAGATAHLLPMKSADTVWLRHGPRIGADRAGRIPLGRFRGGRWLAEVEEPGHLPRVLVFDGLGSGPIPVALESGVPLRLRVVDARGHVLPERTVTAFPCAPEPKPYSDLDGKGCVIATTDADGRAVLFVAEGIPHRWSVELQRGEVVAADAPTEIVGGGAETTLRVLELRPLQVEAGTPEGASLKATVRVERVGGAAPLIEREVSRDPIQVPPERLRLTVCPEGSLPEIVEVDASKETAPVRITARPGPVLRGRVIGRGGEGVAGIEVLDRTAICDPIPEQLSSFRRRTRTDATGAFDFGPSNPGLHVLFAKDERGRAAEIDVRVDGETHAAIVIE